MVWKSLPLKTKLHPETFSHFIEMDRKAVVHFVNWMLSSVYLYLYPLFYFGMVLRNSQQQEMHKFFLWSERKRVGSMNSYLIYIFFVSFSSSFVCLFPWFWLLSFPQEVCTPVLPKQSLISRSQVLLVISLASCLLFLLLATIGSFFSHGVRLSMSFYSSFYMFLHLFVWSLVLFIESTIFVHVPPCLCVVAVVLGFDFVTTVLKNTSLCLLWCSKRFLCVISTLGAAVFSASSQSERSPTNTIENSKKED